MIQCLKIRYLRALTSQEFLEMAGATHTLLVKGQYPQAPPKFYFHSGWRSDLKGRRNDSHPYGPCPFFFWSNQLDTASEAHKYLGFWYSSWKLLTWLFTLQPAFQINKLATCWALRHWHWMGLCKWKSGIHQSINKLSASICVNDLCSWKSQVR